jgi:hypothetical protein
MTKMEINEALRSETLLSIQKGVNKNEKYQYKNYLINKG